MSKKKIVGGISVAIILALTGAYFGGRYYFKDHYYPNTSINGVNVSFMTASEGLDTLRDNLEKYTLTIHSADGDMTITADQCGLEYTKQEQVGDIVEEQDEDLWFEYVINRHSYTTMELELDDTKLTDTINNLSCMNPTNPQKPVDAKIEYNESTKNYLIVTENVGNIIVKDKFSSAVKSYILASKSELDLTTNEYYEQPKYFATDDEVIKAKELVDKYMDTVIHYEDAGLTATLDSNSIHTFIKISKDFKVTFDKAVMKTYISKNISTVFNTVGNKRTIHSPGSGTFTASGGSYGWQVGLLDERKQMIEDIKTGKEITREPVYLQDAAQKDRDDDIGDTYVDVNISKQTLWVVKDGKVILTSDFVSGNVSTGHGTHKGIYMVEYKRTNYEMVNYDVTVDYWMPFNTEVGEGFHDAKWRSNFGGSIYKSDGSHGCINLPHSVAKKMYSLLKFGYPVIVH